MSENKSSIQRRILMSEKRFSYEHLNECQMIFDEKTERGYYFNGEQVDIDDVEYLVELLNSLAEENEQLQSTIKHLEEECGARENDYMNLQKENEQLKQQNDLKSDFRNFITEDIQTLKEENKLLKEKLEDIYELTKQTGMIHLRKEQIRQIISR